MTGGDVLIQADANCVPDAYGGFQCAPCANAVVPLDSAGTFDPDGDPLWLLWSITGSSGPGTAVLSGATSAMAQATLTSFAPTYGTVNTITADIQFDANDCQDQDSATLQITFECSAVP